MKKGILIVMFFVVHVYASQLLQEVDVQKRFYVINTDQNKLIVADYSTYEKLKSKGIQGTFATVRDQVGKSLPVAVSIKQAIEKLLEVVDPVITVFDRDESLVQLRVKTEKKECQILTAKTFDAQKCLLRFGKFFSFYMEPVFRRLGSMKAGESVIVSLVSLPEEVSENTQRVDISTSNSKLSVQSATLPVELSSVAVIPQGAVQVSRIASVADTIRKKINAVSSEEGKEALKEGVASVQQVVPSAIVQGSGSVAAVTSAVKKEVDPLIAAVLKSLPNVTDETKELYLFMSKNMILLTDDSKRAQVGERKRDMHEVELTSMPTPQKREFKKENIQLVQQLLKNRKKELGILIYANKNIIGRMQYIPQEGIKKVIYFSDSYRDSIEKDFGTAIRYIIGLDGDTESFKAMLLKGSLKH